jgi:LEA14-like dessication related protein
MNCLMTRHVALPGLLTLLTPFILQGCASMAPPDPPEIQLTRIELLEPVPGSMEQRFAIGLRLINPNNRAVAVEGLDFELDLNDRRLARGVTSEAFELPRLGEAETTVVVTTSVWDILRQAVELSSRRGTQMDYRLRGRLHLGRGFVRSIPFDHRGTVVP